MYASETLKSLARRNFRRITSAFSFASSPAAAARSGMLHIDGFFVVSEVAEVSLDLSSLRDFFSDGLRLERR